MKPIRLPVRQVVEQVLRCGDIDSRYADSSAMLAGAQAHRAIQKTMGPEYQKEVPLQLETEARGIPVILQGRADGVILADGFLTVDEIKTTTLPLEVLSRQQELHLGQAKCYAHILLQELEEPLEEANLQLTYYQLETEELQRHRFSFTREELAVFFHRLLEGYGVWLEFERDWKELRDRSIREAVFPFPSYRPGQRELAIACYRTVQSKGRLYAQAPTGTGKTLSSLFPSIKAMGEGLAEKLFYLTAKTVTRGVAEDAVRRMQEGGLRFKSLTLRAKDKICFCEEAICNPDHCSFARGHYDRVNGAVLDLLEHSDLITPALVEEYGRKHRVCPHEFALDAALWVDLVVGDYNHVFDPTVYLRRFFHDGGGDYVFLIDEAHNLADRVRDMYTASLRKSSFYRLKRDLKDKNPTAARLRKAMGQVNRYLLDRRKEMGAHTSRVDAEPDASLGALIPLFNAAAEEWLAAEQHNGHPLHGELLELYFQALEYQEVSQLYDERYNTITEVEGSEVVSTLYCLDPSAAIGKGLDRAKASVLFSATLTPLPYYREILGGRPGDKLLSLPSPFPPERLLLAAHGGISTRYAHREDSVVPIAEAIHAAVSARRGNYLVFFPSHEYLRQVHGAFTSRFPQVQTLVQQGSMSEEERAAFLERFDSENPETLVGFGALGGIFSEGIDLRGDRLIGSIIVGVGLPRVSLRQDLIRDYFDAKNGRGYDYAYMFPGMNKVLQAAGRVIRSETDYGMALLIDDRFLTPRYRALFPDHWSNLRFLRTQRELDELIAEFQGLGDPSQDLPPL